MKFKIERSGDDTEQMMLCNPQLRLAVLRIAKKSTADSTMPTANNAIINIPLDYPDGTCP